jgi:hypothetical protein
LSTGSALRLAPIVIENDEQIIELSAVPRPGLVTDVTGREVVDKVSGRCRQPIHFRANR